MSARTKALYEWKNISIKYLQYLACYPWVFLYLQFTSTRNYCTQANQVAAGSSKFNFLVCCMPNLLVYICMSNANDLIYQLEVDIISEYKAWGHTERLTDLSAFWVSLSGFQTLGWLYVVVFFGYNTALRERFLRFIWQVVFCAIGMPNSCCRFLLCPWPICFHVPLWHCW